MGLGVTHPTEQGPARRLQLLSLLASCFLPRLLVLSAPFPAVATALGGACTLYPPPISHLVPPQRMPGIHASGTRVLQVLEAAVSPRPGALPAPGHSLSWNRLVPHRGSHFLQPTMVHQSDTQGSLALHLGWGRLLGNMVQPGLLSSWDLSSEDRTETCWGFIQNYSFGGGFLMLLF